jgi:hypothetical protein
MCEFISWIEKDKKVYFLTDKMVYHTLKGRELRKFCGNQEDYIGHGAIRHYFDDLKDGENRECSNFSSPKNFPPLIVHAIKAGDFGRLGQPKGLLKAPAWKAYEEAKAPAWKAYEEAKATAGKAYEEATAPAWKAYEEAKAPAWKAYEEAKAPAWKAYQEATAPAFWRLFADPDNRVKAWR